MSDPRRSITWNQRKELYREHMSVIPGGKLNRCKSKREIRSWLSWFKVLIDKALLDYPSRVR